MLAKTILLVLIYELCLTDVRALWSCLSDFECPELVGSVCVRGVCVCAPGNEPTLSGTLCSRIAPYYTSKCVENSQCASLFTGFECRIEDGTTEGVCSCQSSHHYFLGRCWRSVDYGASCIRDEECQNTLRDPHSMSCLDGVCGCSQGYYFRQRGECRRMGLVPGDGCVLNADCHFHNAACDDLSFTCYDTTESITTHQTSTNATLSAKQDGGVRQNGGVQQDGGLRKAGGLRQDGVTCTNGACVEPFVCHSLGVCVCSSGYYASADGSLCLAYLGSPVDSAEYCVGLFAVVEGGICTCPPNFYYNEDMKDCVKAARRLSDSCVSDAMCHTFGASGACAPPESLWGFRQCYCREGAVWDEQREMCRLFVGIGEVCTADSDCLAGSTEAVCVRYYDQDVSRCACPANLTAVDGLCLNTGLGLGESCQVSAECSRTEHNTCYGGVCSCESGYQQSGDLCLPEIGGTCTVDSDCVVQHTKCVVLDGWGTCLCSVGYVPHDELCWPVSEGFNSTCEVTEQCEALGDGALCLNQSCVCAEKYHYNNGRCRQRIGLYNACGSSSECYLEDRADHVVCRNGLCQCSFNHPYSEELGTCVSGAAKVISNIGVIAAAILYLFLK